jgi:hypothetical protein
MGALMRLLLAASLLLMLSCAGESIDRAEWQSMSHEARLLYVKSLLGEEQAKKAKGGNGRELPLSAEKYVAKIEAAYARGDQRNPAEIFAGF